jgi:hypothetical protein
MPAPQTHREIVEQYFKLVAAQKFEEGLPLFTPDCVTHNVPQASG